MKIECLKNKEKRYPKLKEFDSKNLKNCIPDKWKQLGVSVVLFSLITENKVFATAEKFECDVMSGGLPYYEKDETNIPKGNMWVFIVSFVAFIGIIISFIGILIKKIKNKSLKEENKKYSGYLKVFIGSTIIFCLSLIINLILFKY